VSFFENQQSDDDCVSAWSIMNDMERAGYTKLATRVALTKLVRAKMISVKTITGSMNDEPYYAYAVTEVGASYILSNVDKIELRRKGKAGGFAAAARVQQPNLTIDDDIPF
jgi:hypothetical protein